MRYFAEVIVLRGFSGILPDYRMTWMDVLIFVPATAILAEIMEWLGGSRWSLRDRSWGIWPIAAGILWLSQYILPGDHVPIIAAIVLGGMLWGGNWIWPLSRY
ncbi:MAG: hypothetical protein OWS74_04670 [Firmicutes bacterium]|nr:hypothetical protein [Bacillota bacterium]